jgi:hypothetical protein
MSAPKFPLLLNKDVQQELKISTEQLKKIQEILPASSGFPFAPGGQGGGQFKIMVAPGGGNKLPEGGIRALPSFPDFSKTDDDLNKVLDQPQRDRLKQLWLQQQGLMALAQEKVADDVGLEAEQRTLVKEAIDHHQTSMRDFIMDPENRTDQTKIRDFFKTQRERTENDISLLLSDKQKENWQKLLGPKFDFKAK